MRKWGRKLSASALIAAMILSACVSGCSLQADRGAAESKTGTDSGDGADTDTTEDYAVTLTFFDKNSGDATFDDAVADRIMEETGVRIEVVDPTSQPAQRLEVMLSQKDYPDMILMGQGEVVNRYIASGALISLDNLIEYYGDHIKEMYGDVLDKCRYTDGNLYWLPNWYGPDTDASAGVLMRKDLLSQIVGEERANSNEPFTQSEYTQILEQFQEQFPELEGQQSIALELDGDAANFYSTLRGMYGLKSYGVDENNQITYLPATETYRDALLYLNQLYREGLLDKEWVISKTAQWEKKLEEGYVFSTWCSYWDVDTVNEVLSRKLGEDAQFYCYKVVADGLSADQTTYNARNGLGWDAIAITDNCKNPEAAIKVADFLASEEGQYLMLWGVEGETWDEENGIHVAKTEFLDAWAEDQEETQERTGVRKWTWFIKNGDGSDGTPYDLTTKYIPDQLTAFANASFPASDYWDTSELSGLEPAGNTLEGLKWLKITNLYDQYNTKIITASTEAEALSQYRKMVNDMAQNGLEEIEEYMSEQYQQRMKNWYGE